MRFTRLAGISLLSVSAACFLSCAGGSEPDPTPASLPTRPGPSATPRLTPTSSPTTAATLAPASPTASPETPLASATATTPGGAAANTPTAQATAAPRPSQVSLRFRADNLAFDRTIARVPAGATVTATFQNDDAGIEHNLSFSLPGLAHGDTCTGPCTATQTFIAQVPGSYFFLCTIHDMSGAFIVDP